MPADLPVWESNIQNSKSKFDWIWKYCTLIYVVRPPLCFGLTHLLINHSQSPGPRPVWPRPVPLNFRITVSFTRTLLSKMKTKFGGNLGGTGRAGGYCKGNLSLPSERCLAFTLQIGNEARRADCYASRGRPPAGFCFYSYCPIHPFLLQILLLVFD